NDRVRYTYRDYPWDLFGEQKGWLQYTETAKVAPWWLPPTAQVTNAHNYTGQVYDYYLNTFGRVSYDGMGARMDAVAEMPTAVIGYNAFWNGAWTAFTSGMVTKDIVGHEWTHAVSQASAGLDYVNASGAVNEAHSDIFGSMIDRDDWELGEGSALGVIRSMEDPEAYDQPAHIDDALVYVPLCIDNGGVHINSGIINHAFYLLATALDKERAEQIAYRALTRHMVPSTNFTQTRMAYLAAADDLYGAASAEYAAVETAFAGVGITAATVEPYYNCWYSIPPDDEMWGPYPEIVASQRTGVAPLSVDFEAVSRTVEEQGGEILFDWDFGDGATASGGAVSHTFTDPGTYVVEVTALHDTEFTDPSTASYTLPITVYEKKSKVMAIAYDPILSTRGNARMSDYLSWRDPAELAAQMAEDMGAAAGIAYEIAETHTVGEFPAFEDSYTYPEDDYLEYVMGRGGPAHAGTTDYSAIMDRFDVCAKVASDNISEVWLIGGPDFGFEDWAFKIPGDAVPHAPSDPAFYPSYDLPDCGSTYTVMGWSVQPEETSELGFSTDDVLVDALDAFAMRAAGVLSLTVGQGEWYDADPSNPWRAFSLYERDYPGEAGVGGPRNPPNATVERDYFTGHTPGASVTSTADDWYDYPVLTGATQTLDCYTWACDGVGYLRWYLAHIPRAAGTSVIGSETFSNNWWDYIVDYDGRLDATSTVPNAAPTAVLSATPLTGSAPLDVDLDAGASTDVDGSIVSYEWDYDGDGTVDATSGTATSAYTYSSPGTYWPRVAVVDDDGAVSTVDAGPVTLAAPIPPDEVSVTISGGINYSATGALTSGDVNVNPAGTGTISTVTGSGTIPGPNSGTATVTFSVSRVSWAGSYNGSVRVSDPTNGVSLTASLFFTQVRRDAGQPRQHAVDAELAQERGEAQPRAANRVAEEEAVVTEPLIERHQQHAVVGSSDRAVAIARQLFAVRDRVDVLEPGLHDELAVGADRVTVRHFDDAGSAAPGVLQHSRALAEVRDALARQRAGRFEQDPDRRFVPRLRRRIAVLPALDDDRGVAALGDELAQRAFDRLLESEQQRDRQPQCGAAVLQRVAAHRERQSGARGRVQVDEHELRRGLHQRLDQRQQLALLALFRGVLRRVLRADALDLGRIRAVDARDLRELDLRAAHGGVGTERDRDAAEKQCEEHETRLSGSSG
ncbi:MAG: M4 family metallopeptidase, partial [Planctomycetaceae bacterium]|nr:M4 family metallopeptidase [Planctomycetaceae bacterium]